MSLEVHERNHVRIWMQLAKDYNTVTLAQRSAARKEFLNFVITEEESYLDVNQRYNELLMSDGKKSCANMVIYRGKWINVPTRWNGAVAGICVLYPCLGYAWVFYHDDLVDTCPNGRICHLQFK